LYFIRFDQDAIHKVKVLKKGLNFDDIDLDICIFLRTQNNNPKILAVGCHLLKNKIDNREYLIIFVTTLICKRGNC